MAVLLMVDGVAASEKEMVTLKSVGQGQGIIDESWLAPGGKSSCGGNGSSGNDTGGGTGVGTGGGTVGVSEIIAVDSRISSQPKNISLSR